MNIYRWIDVYFTEFALFNIQDDLEEDCLNISVGESYPVDIGLINHEYQSLDQGAARQHN